MTGRIAVLPLAGLCCAEAVTSLGESIAETALLYRAGISNVAPSDFIDAAGQRVLLCAAPSLPPDLLGPQRLLALAAHALAGVHRKLRATRDEPAAAPAILLCLSERHAAGPERPFEPGTTGRAFVSALRERLPPDWATADIEVFPYCRAGGALAMRRALQLLAADRNVVWGGVDTLADWPVLLALEQADRLLTADNVDGVRPGEAAAFLAVVPAAQGEALLLGLGLGREPHPLGADEPCRSDGLSQALDGAVAPLRAAGLRSDLWFLDATHESHATQEIQNIVARFGDVLGTQTDLQMPLKELGDVGAAALPLLAALAMQDWRHGVARDRTAVLAGSTDSGARGAMLLGALS